MGGKKTCSGINLTDLQDCTEVITDGNNLSVRLIGEFVPEGLITSFKPAVLRTRVSSLGLRYHHVVPGHVGALMS